MAYKKIGQTEDAQEGNNYSQDQLSMGGSKGDITKLTKLGKLLQRGMYFF